MGLIVEPFGCLGYWVLAVNDTLKSGVMVVSKVGVREPWMETKPVLVDRRPGSMLPMISVVKERGKCHSALYDYFIVVAGNINGFY